MSTTYWTEVGFSEETLRDTLNKVLEYQIRVRRESRGILVQRFSKFCLKE